MILNPQIKKTIVDALMQVVDSAPCMTNRQYTSDVFSNYPRYYQAERTYSPRSTYNSDKGCLSDVSNENFKIWINYVFSVLNITAQQVDSNLSYLTYSQVQNVVRQVDKSNFSKTTDICSILLEFARKIILL